MYALTARNLVEAQDQDQKMRALREFVDKLRERKPTYTELRIYLQELVFVSTFTKQRGLTGYIVRKVDDKLRGDGGVGYASMTIEHLEPQKRDDSPG
jgi:hypothetical protein